MKKLIILLAIISCQGLIYAQTDTTRTIQVFEDELGNKIEGFIIGEDDENLTIKGTDSLIYTVAKKKLGTQNKKQNPLCAENDSAGQKELLLLSSGLGAGAASLLSNYEDISFLNDFGPAAIFVFYSVGFNFDNYLVLFEYSVGSAPFLGIIWGGIIIINDFSLMAGYSFNTGNEIASFNIYGGVTFCSATSLHFIGQSNYHEYSSAGFKVKTELLLNIFQWFSIGLYASDIINTDLNFYDVGALFKINIKLR